MRTPKRIYNATHIADGVRMVAKLQQKVLQKDPMAAGPMAALKPQPAAPGEDPVEMHEAHCLSCGTKRPFQVEGEETMKNGALRKHGTGTHEECGHKMSAFVSGKDKAAASG